NRLLAGVVTPLLEALRVHPSDPNAPIPNFVAMELLVFVCLVGFFIFVRTRLSVDSPGRGQHIMELLREFLHNLGHELIGHDYEVFLPFLGTLSLFLLTSNLLFLIPSLESPTASPGVPLGCALTSFCYYHYAGLHRQGLHYFKQFVGPVWALAWLMVPIELI